ncbi:tail tubular A-like protein [Klebsiella phage SH-Kp 152410]|uniref:Tail tubular A-like protein n=1 Tax=Klebsiella phage SH-Kp 152410 TaxID=2066504 RepID=A0A7T3KA34_9CAUD|nr:tail tubular A-like protein [Klebsiella phage SH-Kp 152410]
MIITHNILRGGGGSMHKLTKVQTVQSLLSRTIPDGGCLEWTGSLRSGYGRVTQSSIAAFFGITQGHISRICSGEYRGAKC